MGYSNAMNTRDSKMTTDGEYVILPFICSNFDRTKLVVPMNIQ